MQAPQLVLARVTAALFLMPGGAVFGQSVESKAWAINVPLLELRDATVEESIRALMAKSREFDPAHAGINFVWPTPLPAETRLNLRLSNVPLREAARYVARLAGMKVSADRHALVFSPAATNGIVATPVRMSPAARTAAGLILAKLELGDATLPEALDFLASRGRALDPKKQGVNIVLDAPVEYRDAKITLSLQNVPLGEALRYAAQLANLVVVEEPYALVLTTPMPKRIQRGEPLPAAKEESKPENGFETL